MALPLKINIDVVMKLPLSKRLMILGAVNVVIVGAILWFLILPKKSDVKSLRAQMQDLNGKLTENRQIAADIPKFVREKEELENKLKAAVAQLPNEKEIPNLIDSISEAAKTAGLRITIFKPGPEVKKGFYAEVPVNMTVEGKFESLYDFGARVAGMPRIVNIGNLNIVTTSVKSRIPTIKSDFVSTTFRFIPAPTEGAAKEGAPKK